MIFSKNKRYRRLTKLINDSIDPDFKNEVEFIKNELRDLPNGIYRKNQVVSLILKRQKILDQRCPTCNSIVRHG